METVCTVILPKGMLGSAIVVDDSNPDAMGLSILRPKDGAPDWMHLNHLSTFGVIGGSAGSVTRTVTFTDCGNQSNAKAAAIDMTQQSNGSGARAPGSTPAGKAGPAKATGGASTAAATKATGTAKTAKPSTALRLPGTVPVPPEPLHAVMERLVAASDESGIRDVLASAAEFTADTMEPLARAAFAGAVRGQVTVSGSGKGNNCFPTSAFSAATSADPSDPVIRELAEKVRWMTATAIKALVDRCNARELDVFTDGKATAPALLAMATALENGGMFDHAAYAAFTMVMAEADQHWLVTIHQADVRTGPDGLRIVSTMVDEQFTAGVGRYMAPVSSRVDSGRRRPIAVTLHGQHFWSNPTAQPGMVSAVAPAPISLADLAARVTDLYQRMRSDPKVVYAIVDNNRSVAVSNGYKFLSDGGDSGPNGLDRFFGDKATAIYRVAAALEPSLVAKAAAERVDVVTKEAEALQQAGKHAAEARVALVAEEAAAPEDKPARRQAAVKAVGRMIAQQCMADDLRLKEERLEKAEALRRSQVSTARATPFVSVAADMAQKAKDKAARAAAVKTENAQRERDMKALAARRKLAKEAKLAAISKQQLEVDEKALAEALKAALERKGDIEKDAADAANRKGAATSAAGAARTVAAAVDGVGHAGKKRGLAERSPGRPGSTAATTVAIGGGTATQDADEVMAVDIPEHQGAPPVAQAPRDDLGLARPPPTFAAGQVRRNPQRRAAMTAANGLAAVLIAEEEDEEVPPPLPDSDSEDEAPPTQPVGGGVANGQVTKH